MLKKPQDFVISGGNVYSVRKLAEKIFLKFNINKNKIFYKTKSKFIDIKIGNTSKLKKLTGWKPKYTEDKFIDKIINDK